MESLHGAFPSSKSLSGRSRHSNKIGVGAGNASNAPGARMMNSNFVKHVSSLNKKSVHTLPRSFAESRSGNATLDLPGANSTLTNTAGEKTNAEGDATFAGQVLRTYVTRRKLLERASILAGEMNAKMQDIASMEAQRRLFSNHAGIPYDDDMDVAMEVDGGGEAAKAKGKKQQPSAGNSKPEGDAGLNDDAGNIDLGDLQASPSIAVESAANEEALLKARIRDKRERLSNLRSIQWTLAEVENEGVNAGTTTKHSPSLLYSRYSIAGTHTHSPTGSTSQANHEYHIEQLRNKFHSLFEKEGNSDIPPDPPRVFSSNAFAVTLEYIESTLQRVVDTTDQICVAATFKTRDEPVNIFPWLRKLQIHSEYLSKCYEVTMNHLSHFDLGERSLLEGGTLEVNALREHFLLSKETLAAQEQKEKFAEEFRHGLIVRLRNLTKRCDMWEEFLLGRSPQGQLMFPAESPSAMSRPSWVSGRNSEREGGASRISNVGEDVNEASGGVAELSAQKRAGSAAGLLGGYLHRANPQSRLDFGGNGGNWQDGDEAHGDITDEDLLHMEDVMEMRVAQSWGNPYVEKARKYGYGPLAQCLETSDGGVLESPVGGGGRGSNVGLGAGLGNHSKNINGILGAPVGSAAIDVTLFPPEKEREATVAIDDLSDVDVDGAFPYSRNTRSFSHSTHHASVVEVSQRVQMVADQRTVTLLQNLLRSINVKDATDEDGGRDEEPADKKWGKGRKEGDEKGKDGGKTQAGHSANASTGGDSLIPNAKRMSKVTILENHPDVAPERVTRIEISNSIQRIMQYLSERAKRASFAL